MPSACDASATISQFISAHIFSSNFKIQAYVPSLLQLLKMPQ